MNGSSTINPSSIQGIEKEQPASAKRLNPQDPRFQTNRSAKQTNFAPSNVLRTPVNQGTELDNLELKPDVSAFNSSDAVKSSTEGTWTLGGVPKYQTIGSLSNIKQQQNQSANNQTGSNQNQNISNSQVIKLNIPTVIRADNNKPDVKQSTTIVTPNNSSMAGSMIKDSALNPMANSLVNQESRRANHYQRTRDYTSRDAQNFREAAIEPPRMLTYDEQDSISLVNRMLSKKFDGAGKNWRAYLRSLKKELALVDSIISTGGSG